MSHDIESDYREEYDNEERQCPHCQSYENGHCRELDIDVPPTAHCDFFSSRD